MLRSMTVGAVALFCSGAPVLAYTEEAAEVAAPQAVQAAYDFYIGGLPIAAIEVTGRIGDEGYDVGSTVRTRGLLHTMTRGSVDASAAGRMIGPGRVMPGRYATEFSSTKGGRRVEIAYDGPTRMDVTMKPVPEPEPHDTDPSLHGGTLDPVSAALALMMPADGDELCERTIPIFDGRRRYDVVLLPVERRPDDMARSPEPVWNTPLVRCFGVYERIAGFEPELQTRQRFFPFDIWFEQVKGSTLRRPVRIAGKTKLGFAIGNLRRDR